MKKSLFLVIAAGVLFGLAVASVSEAQPVARFDGGIGVIPTGSGNTAVRGVLAAGQIWVIRELRADVHSDGRIRVDGRGLLLGAGNGFAGNANARVFATLICEAAPPFVERSSTLDGVPLEANGDFRIDDVVTPAPVEGCASPVLLIRNAANGGWFAGGIPR
ncbi:MAG TPA: hypothetical protein VFF01_05445 [Candidatus Deferrimicrobiaceae bacterium]|nr:hypothetical protein [Candidatus Deferrimicrobiaceae bacterium]